MSRFRPLSRRTILRGVLRGAVVSVALPPLECFFDVNGQAYAGCSDLLPKRFGLFFWGNGNLPDRWTPIGEGEGDEWQLSDQLASLASVKEYITVVSGMSVKTPNSEAHSAGAAGLLTGSPLQGTGDDSTFAGPTFDQIIADIVGGETLYRSIQTAATDISGLSYNGPNSVNPAETSPYAFYERIFGASFREPGEEGLVDPTLALRQSVLDSVMDQMSEVSSRVGKADQERLEQHFDGIRELEQRLAQLQEDPPNLAACARPGEPASEYADEDGRPQISARNRVMCDMLAMTVACDQTRVFGHYLTDPVNDFLFPGASAGHHSLTHDEGGDQPEVHAITLQCIEEMAYLFEAFAAVPEGDGTLLEHCILLGCSEVSEGRTHSLDEMPLVLAGGGCGALKNDFHYRSYSQENMNKVVLSILRAMDINAAEYGTEEGYVTDGLSVIET